MAAKRIPTILPELSREEKLELSQIYSLCGLLDQERIIQNERPFRSPHHTVTAQALVAAESSRIPEKSVWRIMEFYFWMNWRSLNREF
jgi:predicted ATPase with chaperone activity